MKNAVAEASVAPSRPAAVAITTFATQVPKAPRASIDSPARTVHSAWSSAGNPSGAVRITETASARQTTGRAPLRC